jgi:hypothetical protein
MRTLIARTLTHVAVAFGAVGAMAIGFSTPAKAHDYSYADPYAVYDPAAAEDYNDDYRPRSRYANDYNDYYRQRSRSYEYRYYDPYYRYSNEYDKRVRHANSPWFYRYYYKGFSTNYSSYNRGYDPR